MRLLNCVLVPCLFLLTLISCSKDDIEPEVPKTPEQPTIVEVKEEGLYGTWTMGREDNGVNITTSFEIKEDKTCVYTQTIKNVYPDQIEEVNKVSFNGKWTFDKEKAVLAFNLNDEEGNNALTLDCILKTSDTRVESFKINDIFSENDDYCFKK